MSLSGIELAVSKDLEARQSLGLSKYGVSVENNPLSEDEWIQHAYEEALDLAVYLKRLMSMKQKARDIEKQAIRKA